jgi:hypothetical protein
MPHAFRHGSKPLPKVRIKANPDIPTGIPDTWAVARVGLDDGRELSEQCRHYRGSIANPMSRDEHLARSERAPGGTSNPLTLSASSA